MRAKSRRRVTADVNESQCRRGQTERLEARTLLSGWTTVDTVPPPSTGGAAVNSMTADGAGNVYAAGGYNGQGLLREKASGSSNFVTIATPASTGFNSVFADAAGDVFISNDTTTFERSAGGATFAPVTVNVPSGDIWQIGSGSSSFAADGAGDVFELGITKVPTTTTVRGKTTTTYSYYDTIVKMNPGQTSFTPIQQFSANNRLLAITIINSGPSQGIYAVSGASWIVLKSTDGGATWTTAAPFNYGNYTPNSGLVPYSIASDATGSGNVYVFGTGSTREITGYTYTKVKGGVVQTPVYTYYQHWLASKSSDGGATWTLADDFIPPGNDPQPNVAADLNGALYVVGYGGDGIVRSNVGGSWQTVDDVGSSYYNAVTVDPVTGTPYAGGQLSTNAWFVRSGPPVAPVALTTALATFSTTTISGSSVQPNTGQFAPPPSTSSDGSALTDQLFGNPGKKTHTHEL